MCNSDPNVQATRCLKLSGAQLRQCLGCGTVGVEFGTCYLVFEPNAFFRFADWFELEVAGRPWKDPRREKIYVRLADPGVMLALSQQEVASLSNLLRVGRPWVAEGPTPEAEVDPWQPVMQTARLGNTVH